MTLDDIAARIARRVESTPFEGSLKFDCGDGVIVMADGTATTTDRPTDCTLKITQDNLVSLLTGKLNPMVAMATGRLKLSGDMGVALRLARLIG